MKRDHREREPVRLSHLLSLAVIIIYTIFLSMSIGVIHKNQEHELYIYTLDLCVCLTYNVYSGEEGKQEKAHSHKGKGAIDAYPV